MQGEATYNYKVVRQFAIMTVVWGVVGMLVGVLIASQLIWPALNFDTPWLTYSRLRPLHTNAVIFAFGGCALFATSYYVVQRTCHARLFSDKLAAFTFWGWQAVILAAAITLPLGITTSKEYAELEWPIDLLIAVVWVAYAVVFFGTIAKRQGAAHLRRQLVLRRLHPDDRDPAHRQQRRDPGDDVEVVLGVRRGAGRDGAVVVRAQRGGLLPHCGLPRDDVLLRAQAGGAPGVLVPAFGGALLGADLHLHVGRSAPPACTPRCPTGPSRSAWCSR